MLKILITTFILITNLLIYSPTLLAKRKKYHSKYRKTKILKKKKHRRQKRKKEKKKIINKKKKPITPKEEKPIIIHKKIKAAILKESVDININIKNNKKISFVILHYASFALQDWSQAEMTKTKNGYFAEIPSDFVLRKGVVYYIEAVGEDGNPIVSLGNKQVPIFIETYQVKRANKKVEKNYTYNTNDKNISLKDELSVFTMDDEVETVSQKIQKSKLAPGIVSVIPRSVILKMGAKSLIDVLKYLPGINVKILSSGKYSVAIRGVNKDGNILFMINGNRINNPYNSEAIYDLSTNFIRKIEVIRGPGSSLFGTDAVAGVINIFTTNNDKSIKALVGIYNNYEVSNNYSINRKGIQIDISGGISLDGGANQILKIDDSSELNWSLTHGDRKFETNRWSRKGYLSLNLSNKKFKFFIFTKENKRGTWVGPNYTATNNSTYKTDILLYNLDYTIMKKRNIELTSKIYGNLFWVDNYMVVSPNGYLSTKSKDEFKSGKIIKENYNTLSTIFELSLNWQILDELNLLTGLSYQYLNILDYSLLRNYDLSTDEYHGNKFKLYGSSLQQNGKSRNIIEYHLQTTYNYKKFATTAGLRFDYYNDFGLTINPRIGLVYDVMNLFVIKALYGQAFRAPTMKELYDETDNSENGIIGNKNLIPENVKTSELSVQFDLWKFNINTNLFYNINENIIAPFDEDGSGSVGQYKNIGKTNDIGIESSLKFLLNKYFNAFLNISWFQRKFTWNNNVWRLKAPILTDRESILTNIPMRQVSMGFNFNFNDFSMFLGVRNISTSMNNNTMELESANVVNIPEYWKFDFNIIYNITNNFLIFLTGNEVGNTHYATPTIVAIYGEKGLIQPGYTIRTGLIYKFNFEEN